jgi:hypothetical protein
MKNEEYHLQLHISNYLKYQYPKVVFLSDASGLRMTIGNATKFSKLKSNTGIPDMIILQSNKKYNGICFELKKSLTEIYDTKGKYRQNKHIQEQLSVLKHLEENKYYTDFICQFEIAKDIIDKYMDNKL